ncbi:hypothetical protein X011_20725 [Mycobacterium tuberculosis variant microti OV254]|nr:hypothetical protein X011_20725 [Mycobacterium tuberculosis variant microti OV254]
MIGQPIEPLRQQRVFGPGHAVDPVANTAATVSAIAERAAELIGG